MNPTSGTRHGRALRKASVFAPILLLVAMLAPATVLAADGSGTMTVSPTTVVAGSTGNSLAFTYTAAEAVSSTHTGNCSS